jgi:hypothetical protein
MTSIKCDFVIVETLDSGRYVIRCRACGHQQVSRSKPDRCVRRCGITQIPPGVGTYMKGALTALRIVPTKSCGCEAMARQMNAWGPDGCTEHLDEIVDHLRKAYSKTDWLTIQRARLAAVTTGLAWEINWLDPLPSLVRLAIERARIAPPAPPLP